MFDTANGSHRRHNMFLMTPAELAIYHATLEVESIGADKRLTEAVMSLVNAQRLVADVVDELLADPKGH